MTPPPDRALAEPGQTDLQRELAGCRAELDRRTAERDKALAQLTATAEVLQVINSSPGDLVPVFDAILDKAMRLCEAAFGHLDIYDGERFETISLRNAPAAFAEFRRKNPPNYGPGTGPARMLAGERVFQHLDVKDEDAYRSGELNRRALVDLGGARSVLQVALVKEETFLGFITLFRQEVRPFTDKQIALMQNFAAQAVIAMENARLLTETREALEQQTATAEVLQVINSSPGDLTPVFDAILEKAHSLCGADRGALVSFDGQTFRAAATRGLPAPFEEVMRAGFPLISGGPMDRLQLGEPVHILDLAAAAAESPPELARLQRRAHELAGTRTLLMIPLSRGDSLLGYIAAYRQEVRPFTESQIALLENFAAQAVVAMENARLIAETREALEQQTATAEVLQVINSSPGDLKPVFEAMLEKATRLCEADFGILWNFDAEFATAGALHRVPAAYAEMIRTPFRPSPDSGPARMMRGEVTFVVADLREFAPYRAGDTLVRAIVDLAGARSVVISPLRKDTVTLGAITIYRQEVRPFSEKQIALLQNFAAQAVIAMENARLITETREALEQQTATAEVLQVINSSPGDLQPVFDAMLEKALRLCEAACGHLYTYDGEYFTPAAVRGHPSFVEWWQQHGRVRPLPGAGPLGRISQGESRVDIDDYREDEAYRVVPPFRELVDSSGIRSGIVVALRSEDRTLGSIHVYRTEVHRFSDKQIALLQNFAQQAVIAMENARLLGELRQRTEEVAELNRGLEARVAEQVEELGRVGRLKRFLAPQLAELIVSQGDENILESHRREIVVVFCDLRGYTAFTETAEPEEVLEFLREYHGALGPLVSQFEGTLDQFSGDGIMVFFNDPVPIADPAERAVKMAIAMREAAGELIGNWRRRGRLLGFGAGIAQGYATLGQIGFADRSGYTAIGTVCNLAARLCGEAGDGQILVAQRVAVAVEAAITLEEIGALTLKGLTQPVIAYNVLLGAGQTTLRIIEGDR